MRAIMVAVGYTDLLEVTLPYNRHHFDRVYVVTDWKHSDEVGDVCDRYGAAVLITDSFYEGGAVFNKWRALEWGLDVIGREGWLCLMDADVLWPKVTNLNPDPVLRWGWSLQFGRLYTPLRRMFVDTSKPIPPESEWGRYPVHRNVAEWAGYSQIFHASDPVLGPAPWHDVNWRHAGGADSFFQAKWPKERKKRPPFEVLHIGPAGENWCGRATPYLDGTMPDGHEERRKMVGEIWAGRRARRVRHGPDSDVYAAEKIRRE